MFVILCPSIYVFFCRRLVAQNYLSQTHKDLTPYTRPYGTEVLPRATHQVPSGFINEKALTVPNISQVCFLEHSRAV